MKTRLPVVLFAAILPSLASAAVVERIVAVVNDDIILWSELLDRSRAFQPQVDGARNATERAARQKQLYQELLVRMVDENLLAAQAQKMRIRVTSEEIDRAMRNVARQNNLSEDEFLEALRQQGTTVEEYRQELRRELTRFQVLNTKLRQKIRLTEDDVREFYNRNVREIRGRDRFRAAWILIAVPEGSAATVVAERRAVAERLLARAREGEAFEGLAEQHSGDRATRANGGDLGWRRRGSLPAAVDDALLNLEVGELSGPIRAPEGFHVVKLIERESSDVRPFREVREELFRQLLEEEMQRQERIWLQELRRRAFVRLTLPE